MTYYPKNDPLDFDEPHLHLHRAMLAASQNYSMAVYDGHYFTQTEHIASVKTEA